MQAEEVFERIKRVVHQELDSHPESMVQEVIQDLDLLLDLAVGLDVATEVNRARLFMITDTMLSDAFENPFDDQMR